MSIREDMGNVTLLEALEILEQMPMGCRIPGKVRGDGTPAWLCLYAKDGVVHAKVAFEDPEGFGGYSGSKVVEIDVELAMETEDKCG